MRGIFLMPVLPWSVGAPVRNALAVRQHPCTAIFHATHYAATQEKPNVFSACCETLKFSIRPFPTGGLIYLNESSGAADIFAYKRAVGSNGSMRLAQADRVEILVLVDNMTDILSSIPPIVTGEIARLRRRRISPTMGAAYCCAAHGLSLLVTAYGSRGSKTVLFDGGPADYAIEMNSSRLGVNCGTIESVVLSHSHWDHAGGLPRALGMICAANEGRAVPLFLHPAMFQQRGFRMPDGAVMPAQPFPTEEQWSGFGAKPIVTTEPVTCLDDMFFISGEVPRVTPYEQGLDMNVHRAAADAPWEPEPQVVDERFLAVHVRDKGLVVLSGCSHAGIVNVLYHALAIFPGVPLHAVMGGFHLSGPPSEAIIPETVRDLGHFGLKYVIAGHCTGWRALNALQNALGDQVVTPLAVGRLFSM
jgi:7,8-dihydropterin-6-yl-methyl-4-(beta-D-ribofuranosyl)aminobenzene 5'-phosphate synthase